ncbi:MAG: hypothetical protein WAN36_06945, partial [Calditrichia bacterium]
MKIADVHLKLPSIKNRIYRLVQLLLLLSGIMALMQCGGPKKLSPAEYDAMPPAERLRYLEKLNSEKPDDTEIQMRLYQEYQEQNMPQKARTVMENIIRRDPFNPEVQYDYGVLLMNSGEKQGAYKAFRAALNARGGSAYSRRISEFVGGNFRIEQVTRSSEDEAFPMFSPDGGKIIFQMNRNGNWDIMELALSSGNVKAIVETPADEELPCYSPDGQTILYTSNEEDQRPIDKKYKVRDIYVRQANENRSDNLTETVADDWLPRYAPDGRQIIFVSERSDLRSVPYTEKNSDIYRMDANGAFQVQLTDNKVNDGGACYNGDGSRIFFHSNRNGSYDIFAMQADGDSPEKILGDDDVNEVNPYVSPRSDQIVYFSDRDGNYDIYSAAMDGSNIERLTFDPASDLNPVFSPDGQSIAFHSNR